MNKSELNRAIWDALGMPIEVASGYTGKVEDYPCPDYVGSLGASMSVIREEFGTCHFYWDDENARVILTTLMGQWEGTGDSWAERLARVLYEALKATVEKTGTLKPEDLPTIINSFREWD